MWSFWMIPKGNPTYVFERNRLVGSLEHNEFRIISISTIFEFSQTTTRFNSYFAVSHSFTPIILSRLLKIEKNKPHMMTIIFKESALSFKKITINIAI